MNANKVTYQVGVDVLGFPIYVEHHIYTGISNESQYNPRKTFWLKVIEKIIKQH